MVLFNTAIVFQHIKPEFPQLKAHDKHSRVVPGYVLFQTLEFNHAAELCLIPQQVRLNRTSLTQPWDQCVPAQCACAKGMVDVPTAGT